MKFLDDNIIKSKFSTLSIINYRQLNDLKKYQVSKVLRVEEGRLSNLDKELCIHINWEQKKSWFGFIN